MCRSEVAMSQNEWNLRQIYQTLVDLFHPHHENLSRIQLILSQSFSISSEFWPKPPAEITQLYPWETGFPALDRNPDKANNQPESNQSGGTNRSPKKLHSQWESKRSRRLTIKPCFESSQPRLGSKQAHEQAYS